jgi:hypothetical protein
VVPVQGTAASFFALGGARLSGVAWVSGVGGFLHVVLHCVLDKVQDKRDRVGAERWPRAPAVLPQWLW